VDGESRRGSLLGVEQLLEHSPELRISLPESLGDLVLEVFDGDDAEYECSPCPSFNHTGLVAVLANSIASGRMPCAQF
jgi:hypothetical protein